MYKNNAEVTWEYGTGGKFSFIVCKETGAVARELQVGRAYSIGCHLNAVMGRTTLLS